MGIAGAIKFVLYFDDREKKWRIQVGLGLLGCKAAMRSGPAKQVNTGSHRDGAPPAPLRQAVHLLRGVLFCPQAVNLPSSFELRQGLRAEWRGLRGEQLDEASGITGCVFVHASGFIGGHNTEEGALEMAARSL